MSATGWRGVFGLDQRSLAVWRVALGLLVAFEGWQRLADVEVFLTEGGMLPMAQVPGQRQHFSLLFPYGEPWWATTVVAMLVVSGLTLALGWRTRLSGFVAWVVLTSLQARNPHILFAGDVVLRLMLFWAMFLPVGHLGSVDAAQGRTPHSPPVTVLSAASVGYTLQIALLYWVTGVLKDGKPWRDGTALYHALSADQFAEPLGQWARTQPWVFMPLTWFTYVIEVAAPVLLAIPLSFGPVRTLVVAIYMGLHVGIELFMDIGLFPTISVVCWLPLVPGWLWDRLRWPLADGKGVPWQWWTWLWQWVATWAVLMMLWWNLGSVWPEPFAVRGWSRRAAIFVRLDQYWDMFAPKPFTDDGWHVLSAETVDGRTIDLFRGGAPRRWAKPEDLSIYYPSEHWRKVYRVLWSERGKPLREPFLEWHCRSWNATHAGDDRIVSIVHDYLLEPTPPPGMPDPKPKRVWLASVDCE